MYRDFMLESAMKMIAQSMQDFPSTEESQKAMITIDREQYMATGFDAYLCNGLARLTAFGL